MATSPTVYIIIKTDQIRVDGQTDSGFKKKTFSTTNFTPLFQILFSYLPYYNRVHFKHSETINTFLLDITSVHLSMQHVYNLHNIFYNNIKNKTLSK